MKSTFTLKASLLLFISFLFAQANAQVSTLAEGFDTVPPPNWVIINNSDPIGGTSWFQGDPNAFGAHSGDSSSYIAANFQSTGDTGTISTWLLTPVLALQNSAILKFWTSTIPNPPFFADRLEVRLSTADTSTNVGDSASSVGDFSTLLLTINPNLVDTGYPHSWTEFIDTLSGLKDGATGRIAFRYFVTNGGSQGNNSNYIGLDDVSYSIGTLPVTFINFDGLVRNGVAVLNWSTANELNNKGFEVQRSLDGETFAAIGFVPGAGNSSTNNTYSFTDAKLLSGPNYYRLKQISTNGSFAYSSAIKLDFSKFDWAIAGNPSTNNSWLQLQLDKTANVAVQIVSLNGKIMQTINKGNISKGTYTMPLNFSNAAPGMYVVKLIVDNQTYSKKVIK